MYLALVSSEKEDPDTLRMRPRLNFAVSSFSLSRMAIASSSVTVKSWQYCSPPLPSAPDGFSDTGVE